MSLADVAEENKSPESFGQRLGEDGSGRKKFRPFLCFSLDSSTGKEPTNGDSLPRCRQKGIAMKTCKSCGMSIASNALTCPKCGRKFTSIITKLLIVVFVFIFLLAFWAWKQDDIEKENRYQAVIYRAARTTN